MDGARFIELAGLAADESPLQAIARTFGLAPMNPDATQRVLSEYLRQSHSLLTLDNCERHIDACRRAIEDLLRSCPNVRIVTTSRLALGLAGETIYRVSPLSIPLKLDGAASGPEISDAVELFVERARSAGASESADPLERRAVSAICRHFDGVPLAIELAAARRRLLSASQILARLNDRGLVVDYAHAELQPHQRTVSEAIAWTFATLDADSLSVARMLSVMPGSFGLDAAEAAIGRNGAATLDALGILVDASLLTVIQGSHAARYDMLEPVREFARSELSNDAATAAYARLAGFYAARVGDGDTPPGSGSPPAAFEALEAERLNVRAVLEGCARHRVAEKAAAAVANALVAFWQEQGHVIDGAAVHRALLEAFGAGPSQSTLLIGASRFARLSADYAAARSYASSALEAARSQDQVSTQIDALHAIALVDYTVGDLAQARARHAAARDLAARLGDAAREGRAHANLGLIAIQTAEHDAAAQQLGEAVRLLSDGADDRLLAEATSALAYCERFRGNLGESRSFTLRTVTAAYESGNRSLLSTGLSNLAHLAVLQGDYADAVARLSASLELSRTGAYLFTLVHDMEVAARLFYGLGRFREAAIFLFGARSLNKRLSVLRTPQEEAALSEIEATISANLSAVELAEAAIILRDASATRCADEVLERLVPLRKAHQTAP
jgi:non-specific serine/threonine protein kinase